MDTEKTMGRVLRPETLEIYEFSKSVKFFWTFLEVPRIFQNYSPELRSMSDRNESFWDGLGDEIDGARPEFRGLPKSSPCAEGTFRVTIGLHDHLLNPLLNPKVALTKLPCRGP